MNKSKHALNCIHRRFQWICLAELWNLYLDFCIQRLSQSSDANKAEVNITVLTVLVGAQNC
jgi:hypothetical protein